MRSRRRQTDHAIGQVSAFVAANGLSLAGIGECGQEFAVSFEAASQRSNPQAHRQRQHNPAPVIGTRPGRCAGGEDIRQRFATAWREIELCEQPRPGPAGAEAPGSPAARVSAEMVVLQLPRHARAQRLRGLSCLEDTSDRRSPTMAHRGRAGGLPEQGADGRYYVSQELAGADADSCCLLDLLDPGQILRLGVRVIEASGQRAASVSALWRSIPMRRVSCRDSYMAAAAFRAPVTAAMAARRRSCRIRS